MVDIPSLILGYLVGMACAGIVVAAALEFGGQKKPPEQDHAEAVLLADGVETAIEWMRTTSAVDAVLFADTGDPVLTVQTLPEPSGDAAEVVR